MKRASAADGPVKRIKYENSVSIDVSKSRIRWLGYIDVGDLGFR